MIEKSKIDLSRYRFQDAEEKLESATILLREKHFKDSLSRSYYAMFSAVRALLALRGLDSRKHSGIISLFNQHFVKPQIINASYGRLLKKAQYSRERSDYGDYIIVTAEDARKQAEEARVLIDEIKKVLTNEIGEF